MSCYKVVISTACRIKLYSFRNLQKVRIGKLKHVCLSSKKTPQNKSKKLFNMSCDKDGKISSHSGFPGARNSNLFLQ